MASTSSGAETSPRAGSKRPAPRDPVGWEYPKGKNSFIWEYFEENKALGLVRCTVPGCLKKYQHTDGTSTTNYRRHLKNSHFIIDKKGGKDQPKIDEKLDREGQ